MQKLCARWLHEETSTCKSCAHNGCMRTPQHCKSCTQWLHEETSTMQELCARWLHEETSTCKSRAHNGCMKRPPHATDGLECGLGFYLGMSRRSGCHGFILGACSHRPEGLGPRPLYAYGRIRSRIYAQTHRGLDYFSAHKVHRGGNRCVCVCGQVSGFG